MSSRYFSPSSLTATELQLETAAVKTPYELRAWLAYIAHAASVWPAPRRLALYVRALHYLPGSYKLWHAYLRAFSAHMRARHPAHPGWMALDRGYGRAVRSLAACVRLWEEWIELAVERGRLTRGRQVLGWALGRLAVTQHWRVWEAYLRSGRVEGKWKVAGVGASVMRRYCVVDPGQVEGWFEACVQAGKFEEGIAVARQALERTERGGWKARKGPRGKGAHGGGELKLDEGARARLWRAMIDVGVEHSSMVKADIPQMIRQGIQETKAEVGELWVKLSEYYIRKGDFENAKGVYEEAVNSVVTARDFAVTYDAWAKFEEGLITALMDTGEPARDSEIKDGLDRLERLTSRRPELLSGVLLRQNPHNVHEWHKRAAMYKKAKDPVKVVECYTKAVKTIDPHRASGGRPHTLWLAFARYYEDASVPESARQVFNKAVSDPDHFRLADDLSAVWCEFAEMELRLGDPEKAREVLIRATREPSQEVVKKSRQRKRVRNKNNAIPALGLGTGIDTAAGGGLVGISYDYSTPSAALQSWKSPQLWSFLCDLTLSLCPVHVCIDIYNEMLDHKVATPALVLHSAEHLMSASYFHAAFDLLDRATRTFPYPAVIPLWTFYLKRIILHYRHTKLERIRALFSAALEQLASAPPFAEASLASKIFHLARVQFELDYGSPRLAMAAFSKAADALQGEDRLAVYKLYIIKASELWGTTRTRDIYEEALSKLGGAHGLEIAARYAKMEDALGEVARARAIYSFGTQCLLEGPCDAEWYWNAWRSFELERGDEDTFSDMLRVKRSIEQRLPRKVVPIGDGAGKAARLQAEEEEKEKGFAELERQAQLRTSEQAAREGREDVSEAKDLEGDGEIELDLDDEGEGEETLNNGALDKNANKSDNDLNERDGSQPEKKVGTGGDVLKITPAAKALMENAVMKAAGFAKDVGKLGEVSESPKDVGPEGREKPLGALERFKRRRTSSVTESN